MLVGEVGQLDDRTADRDLRMHDTAVRFRHAESLFGSENLLQEIEELRRAVYDHVRRKGMKSFANRVYSWLCCCCHCFLLQLSHKPSSKIPARQSAKLPGDAKQFARGPVKRGRSLGAGEHRLHGN